MMKVKEVVGRGATTKAWGQEMMWPMLGTSR